MPTALVDRRTDAKIASSRAGEPTIESLWLTVGGRPAGDDLLLWPADVFAFTEVILDRAEAYRFTVSPPSGRVWPPKDMPEWREDVEHAARHWSGWAETPVGDPPELVAREWQVVRDALDTRMLDVVSGRAWRICEALLTLHAVADEACAGLAAGTPAPENGIVLRARMSELLARQQGQDTGTARQARPGERPPTTVAAPGFRRGLSSPPRHGPRASGGALRVLPVPTR